MSVLQNFYTEDIAVKLLPGAEKMYLSAKPIPEKGYLVINPGHRTQREIIKYSATGSDASGDYVVLSARGVGGTTEQSHEFGEPVRMNLTAEHWAELVAIVDSAIVADNLDTSITLGGDESSDTKVPSQKAAKTYVDMELAKKVTKTGDETIDGVKTFQKSPKIPPATNPDEPITFEQWNAQSIATVGVATETAAGLVKIAQDTHIHQGIDTDTQGNPLVPKPSQVQAAGIKWNAQKAYSKKDIVNKDGELFVSLVDNNTTDPSSYSLNEDWTKLSQSFSVSFSHYSYTNIRFNDDLTYVVGFNNSTLTIAHYNKETGAVSNIRSHNVSGISRTSVVNGLSVNNDITKIITRSDTYNIAEITLSTPADPTSASVTRTVSLQKNFLNVQNEHIFNMSVLTEGVHAGKRIALRTASRLYVLEMTDPWNIDTLQNISNEKRIDAAEALSYGRGDFSDDGTKWFAASNQKIYSFSCATPFSLNKITDDSASFTLPTAFSNYARTIRVRGNHLYYVDNASRLRKLQFGVSNVISSLTDTGESALLNQGSYLHNFDISLDEKKVIAFSHPHYNGSIYKYDIANSGDIANINYLGSLSLSAGRYLYGASFINNEKFIVATHTNEMLTKQFSDSTLLDTKSFQSSYSVNGIRFTQGKLLYTKSGNIFGLISYSVSDYSFQDPSYNQPVTFNSSGNYQHGFAWGSPSEIFSGGNYSNEYVYKVSFDGALAHPYSSQRTKTIYTNSVYSGYKDINFIKGEFVFISGTCYQKERIPTDDWAPKKPSLGPVQVLYNNTSFSTHTFTEDCYMSFIPIAWSFNLMLNGVVVGVSAESSSNYWNGNFAMRVQKGDVLSTSRSVTAYLVIRLIN